MNSWWLPKYIKPLKYRIRIEPLAPDYEKFKGCCCIIKKKETDTNTIIFNSFDLDINDVYLVNKDKEFPNLEKSYDPKKEQTKIIFEKIPDEGMLVIECTRKILLKLPGFLTKENNEWIFCIIFEPIKS